MVPTSNHSCGPDKLKRSPISHRASVALDILGGVAMRRFVRHGFFVAILWLTFANCVAHAQTPVLAPEPQIVEQAQTVRIPLQALQQESAQPVKDLSAGDLTFDFDGKPTAFQLTRPWQQTINEKTGQPEDRPSVLIILPLASPQPRGLVIDEAMRALSAQAALGWNISILDSNGNQTSYTRDMKIVIANLERTKAQNPDQDLDDWRRTATLAIATMKGLPGRRIVLSLGDLFHEAVFQNSRLVYDNFEIQDVAAAARDAGAVIYSADTLDEIEEFRKLAPSYVTIGSGPWLLLSADGHVAGWITGTVSETIRQIQQDGMGAYELDVHLSLAEMNGQPRAVSVTAKRPRIILSAPPYVVAPDLAELQLLSRISPALRQALKAPPPAGSTPLQLTTQLEYFPHRDGKSGTQTVTTGFYWNAATAPPTHLDTALELMQTSVGYIATAMIGQTQWSSAEPVWNTTLPVIPGAYRLRVAAADATGKITAAFTTPFTVEAGTSEPVLISSLVLGKSCVFVPPAAAPAISQTVDYLRAGNCELQPDPNHYYSPRDVVWTLVRITPVGELAARPGKDWKASFLVLDSRGSKKAEEPVQWLTASDGSFVATAAFPLSNPKLKLENGEYAVIFRLRGPGIDDNYAEDAPFMVYGVGEAARR
jgi:hypothetical protein